MASEATYFGGAYYAAPGTSFSLSYADGRLHVFTPSANVDCTLPKARRVAFVPGAPVFCIINRSMAYTITLKDSGGDTVRSVGPRKAVHLALASVGSDSGRWHAVVSDDLTGS